MEIDREKLHTITEALGIEVLPFQEDLITDRETKQWCLNCGRKVGKTTGIQLRTFYRLLYDQVPGNGLSGGICVLSKGLDQAKQILQGVKTILDIDGWTFTKWVEKRNADKKIAFTSSREIRMPNGNRFMCMPAGSTGDSVRPYSWHELIFDEADFIPQEVYNSIIPTIARFNGVLILESTPNPQADTNSFFARAFFGKNSGYKIYNIPTSMVKHVSAEWLTMQRRTMTKESYEREYECKFSADAAGVFDRDLCFSCMARGSMDWDSFKRDVDAIFLGVDFARFGSDQSVIATNFYRDGISHIKIDLIEGQHRVTEIEGRIANIILSDSRITRVCLDESAIGAGPTDSLAERFGSDMITGIINHARIHDVEGTRGHYLKEDLYTNLLRLMEKKKIVFDDDLRIVGSLLNMRYEYRKSGNVTIWGSDSHIAEAVVRAVFPVWAESRWTGSVKDAIRIL